MKIIVRRPHTGPSIPELGAPTAITFDSITLPLVRPSTGPFGVASYRIEKAPAIGGPWTLEAEGPLVFGNPPAQYTDSGLVGNTDYFYRASATDNQGFTSEWCAVVTARTTAQTDGIPPTLPTGLSVLTLSSSSQRVSWNPSTDTGGSGLAGYRLERSLNGTSGWTATHSGLLTGTTLDVTGLAASTTYFYRVQAEDGAGNVSPFSVNASGTTQAAVGGAITPSLVVEFVDTSGVRQATTVVSGVTTITGVAPFRVHIDATGTRSTVANATTEAGAWNNIGFRCNYGENRGTVWPISNRSRDEDIGPPVFDYVYETPGTYQLRLRCRDSAGNEATVSCNVVINARPTATNIAVSGPWPTWQSNTHYTLNAGGDYRGKGDIVLSGLHNVIITKVGAGADPLVGTVFPDGRNVVGTPQTRTRGCRFLNIDIARWYNSAFGSDHCYAVNGRVRAYSYSAPTFVWNGNNGTQATADNIRYARGTMFYNTGELTQLDNNYAMIEDPVRAFAFIGGTMVKNGSPFGGGAHVLRGIFQYSTFRHSMFVTDTTSGVFGWLKIGGMEVAGVTAPDAWDAQDRVGIFGLRLRSIPSKCMVVQFCQFGRAGDQVSTSFGMPGYAPQNNDLGSPVEGLELVTQEDCWTFRSSIGSFAVQNTDLGGRNMANRNVRLNLGAGAHITASTQRNLNRIPPGWNGPYIDEATNTRPVPSVFT